VSWSRPLAEASEVRRPMRRFDPRWTGCLLPAWAAVRALGPRAQEPAGFALAHITFRSPWGRGSNKRA
jgi:hypothetical protein